MLLVLVEAKLAIERRLAEITAEHALEIEPVIEPREIKPVRRPASRGRWLHQLGVRAGRSCGRTFACAFRRARAAADTATAGMLYGLLRNLEKQIWLIDPDHARVSH